MEPSEQVVVQSSYACPTEYVFSMCAVQAHVVTLEDVMVQQTAKKEWTAEEHKLLTQVHEAWVFNKLDLFDKQLMQRLQKQLMAWADDNGSGNDKDDKHKRRMAKLVTHNAKLSQLYIGQVDRPRGLERCGSHIVEKSKHLRLAQRGLRQLPSRARSALATPRARSRAAYMTSKRSCRGLGVRHLKPPTIDPAKIGDAHDQAQGPEGKAALPDGVSGKHGQGHGQDGHRGHRSCFRHVVKSVSEMYYVNCITVAGTCAYIGNVLPDMRELVY